MSSKSLSLVEQTDKSIQAADTVQTLLGADSSYSSTFVSQDLANSLLITGNNTGEVIFNQFPEQAQKTVEDLIGVTKSAITQSAQTQQQATSAIANKLQELSLGESSIIPKIAMYALVAFGIFIVVKGFKK